MNPTHPAPGATLYCGDCLEVMRSLPSGSVQTCITSPPYYGLRDYGHDGQIGLEETPEAYIAKLVDVFREVRRLLRDDGTLWLNLGDSYNGSGGAGGWADNKQTKAFKSEFRKYNNPNRAVAGLKPKDLIGIPWMAAFALRADGWWLRADIIWAKKAPLPESVTDRPTRSHEYLFLLTKSARYYYDADAIAEPLARPEEAQRKTPARFGGTNKHIEAGKQSRLYSGNEYVGTPTGKRNKRSVWSLGPEPYREAHFATMPTKLVEPCILAGTSAKGCCAKCGAPWERVTRKDRAGESLRNPRKLDDVTLNGVIRGGTRSRRLGPNIQDVAITVGWRPTCTCGGSAVPCTVLDPFNGSGTVGAVALKHNRQYVGIDLNPAYIELAQRRIQQSQPMLPLEVTP